MMPNPANPNDIVGLRTEWGPINESACISSRLIVHLIRREIIKAAELSIVRQYIRRVVNR